VAPEAATPSAATLAPEGVPFAFAAAETPEGFAQRMAMSDMFEIASSRLALERAQSPTVKTFAQTMIDAHTATANEMKSAMQSQNFAPPMPVALDPEHQGRVTDLTTVGAPGFDKLYLDQQTAAHEAARATLESYAANGTNSALKAWAGRTAATVRQHLAQVRILDRAGADGTESPPPPDIVPQ
jgi:putative membrane protein